jgi:hypothetical protein
MVAEQLGYRFVDEEIVARAAEKEDLDPELVADAEKRKSFLGRYLEELGEAAGLDQAYAYGALGVPAVAGAYAHGGGEGLRGLIREAIHETAEDGDVVIVSHGASMALAGREGVLRVLITASPETRAGRIAAAGVGERDAAKAVKESDAARADYFKRFYRLDRELPIHYDLVISTDVLSEEQAAGLVVQAARS